MIRLQEQQNYEIEINEFGDKIVFEMGDAEYPSRFKKMLDELSVAAKKADRLGDIADVDEQFNQTEALQREACEIVDRFFGVNACRNFTKTQSNPSGYSIPSIDVVLDFVNQAADEYQEASGTKFKKIERKYANRAERRRQR